MVSTVNAVQKWESTYITSTCDTDFGAERLSMLEVLPIGETVGWKKKII